MWKLLLRHFKPAARYGFTSRSLPSKRFGLFPTPSLQKLFDSRHERPNLSMKDDVGIFGVSELKDRHGFYLLKQQAHDDAETLVNEATDPNRSRKLVQVFDELSNALCRVADMAEFLRVAHPDKDFAEAAEEACMSVGALVEKLNTNTELYASLRDVVQNGDKFEEDDVDKRVAKMFLFDFEQSGIHLEEDKRQKFVDLNERIMHTTNVFHQNTYRPVRVPKSKVPPLVNMWFLSDSDTISVPGLMSDHEYDTVRQTAYKLFLSEDREQKELFDSLLLARFLLAQLVGFDTYAHRALRETMAETPENVRNFLDVLSENLWPRAVEDFQELKELKRNSGVLDEFMPWDYPYYSAKAKQLKLEIDRCGVAPYFSLGNCMEGLNMIFKNLYGVELKPESTQRGELWSPDVQKLVVVHDTEGTLGHIYCDLFERPGKYGQDCHFTIRGGRENTDGSYQMPVVVLHLNLPSPPANRPCLLVPSNVENLFHEFGHAMHSMLARTRYQHVTGTRCSTDFAEVPSILMEYFYSDPRVMSQICRHYLTNEPLPAEYIHKLCSIRNHLAASDMQQQLFYAVVDQVYHGSMPLEGSTTDVLERLQSQYYGLPYVPKTAWQLRFGHFVGYGAKYYSYLMSRAVASRIWHKCFKDDPFSRSMGEKYRREVLSHGGGKHPAELVEGLLGEKPTTEMLVTSLMEDIAS